MAKQPAAKTHARKWTKEQRAAASRSQKERWAKVHAARNGDSKLDSLSAVSHAASAALKMKDKDKGKKDVKIPFLKAQHGKWEFELNEKLAGGGHISFKFASQ